MVNIVLFEPEIPFNTANIIRTCVGANANLHIIEPCGFDLSKEHPDLKRGSTNYLDSVNLKTYPSFEEFEITNNINQENIFILTRYGKKIYSEITYNEDQSSSKDIYVMFGKESNGVPINILKKYENNTFRIPMAAEMRSLNLSNCVALVTFELLRQNKFKGLAEKEPHKINYLD